MDIDIECCEEETSLRNKKRMDSKDVESYMKKLELEMIQELKLLSTNDTSDENLERNMLIPCKDLEILAGKIEKILPKEESFSSWTRMKFIDWNEIAFNEYSAEQCRLTWVSIMKKQRHYRTMSEQIANLKEQIMQSNSGCNKFGEKNKLKRKLNTHSLKISKAKLKSCRKSLNFSKNDLKMDYKSTNVPNKSSTGTGLYKYLQDLRNRYNVHGIDVLDEH